MRDGLRNARTLKRPQLGVQLRLAFVGLLGGVAIWLLQTATAAQLPIMQTDGGATNASLGSVREQTFDSWPVPDTYIVTFSGPSLKQFSGPLPPIVSNETDQLTELSSAIELMLSANFLGAKVLNRYRASFIGFSAVLPPEVKQEFERIEGVSIEQVREFSVLSPHKPPMPIQPGTRLSWGLDRIDRRVGLNGTFDIDQTSGLVNVYVIDGGIWPNETQFGNRLRLGVTMIADGRGTRGCRNNGHGTHVAGTIGSKDFGVANEVTLYPVRVVRCDHTTNTDLVRWGIEWVAANVRTPAVVNISVQIPKSAASKRIDDAVQDLVRRKKVTVVVAAGNGGIGACQISPARAPDAITVGSVGPFRDERDPYSNIGKCVDLFAPGIGILSVGTGTETADLSGTSMAAPHVAGVAALYLQAHPTAEPDEVRNAIIKAANVWPDCPGWPGIRRLPPPTPEHGQTVNRLLYWGTEAPC